MVEELEVDKLLINHWEKETNNSHTFGCDYWDCSHKIRIGDTYYTELYPGEQSESYCVECSAFFLAQALNLLMEK